MFTAALNLSAQDTARIVERFERTYRSSKTLQANFLQIYSENGRQVRSEAGVAYFARPGRMRWEYHSPEHNLYVIDGKWSWFYVADDHTATRIKAKESSDWRTPLALLAGEMKVSRICGHVSQETVALPSISSNLLLRCELRGSADRGEQVLFEVNPVNGELARIIVMDHGGIQVEFRFSNWQFDPRLDRRMFEFLPPKGVAIVNGDLMAPSEGLQK